MRVWIERDECQGSEMCVETVGEIFATDEAYVSYVRLGDETDGVSPDSAIEVPENLRSRLRSAAAECPAQCIHVRE